MYYYKVQTVHNVTPYDIRKYDSLNKYLIVHQRDSAWHLSSLGITGNTLSGKLSVLPENRYKFLTTKPNTGNRYKKSRETDESYILEEVHLYISDSMAHEHYYNGNIQVAFSALSNAEVYQKASGRTSVSWLIPVFGGIILVGGAVGVIVAGSMIDIGGVGL